MHDKDSNNAKASSKSCTCNLQLLNIKDTHVGSQTAPLKSANTIIAVRTAHKHLLSGATEIFTSVY